MRGTFDTPGKRAVRELWNTPFLRYLHEAYGVRYRYMGLPGSDLLDVKLWRRMINEVIAFEVPVKPSKGDPDGRQRITALRRNLRLLGMPGRAFFGPIEEVVVLKEDYDGTVYSQAGVITLYNLDFCDEIASRIPTRKQGEQVWRFAAIRQILMDQAECHRRVGEPSLFVILLTARDQMDARKLKRFLARDLFTDTQEYVDACAQWNPIPKEGYVLGSHTWALKAFLSNTLRWYLSTPHISALFFPVVTYLGTPVKTRDGPLQSPMLHLMMLCRFGELQKHSPVFLPKNYLARATSVRACDDQTLALNPGTGESAGKSTAASPVAWFQPFEERFLAGMTQRELGAAV